jgi:pimeloyl-ACP methyl ester carboxylesterase
MTRSHGRVVRTGLGIGLAFGAGYVGAGALAAFRRDMRRARRRLRASHIAETERGPIEFAEAGSGAPILVVHGAGGGFDQGLDFARTLAARGFRIIAMSRFGYLRTPLPADASAEAQADAHARLLDALRIERAAIIGASAGAPSALQFALRHPQRCSALVLMVPALYAPHAGEASSLRAPSGTEFAFATALRSDLLLWAALRFVRRLVTRALLATPPEVVAAAEPEEQARVLRILDHILPVTERRLGLVNDARITSTLTALPLDQVTAPTLVMSVADDLFGTWDVARYTAERIPGARFLGYERGGHVWVGHDREVTEEIARFLQK